MGAPSGPGPRLAAVIGSPVAHSLSPAIHRAAFGSAGVDWSYTAFDVADGEVPEALDAMRTLGIAGLSVTMPHKEAVAASVDRLDDAAAALRSVNTVSWQGRELVGSSTDGAGFVASLDAAGVDVVGTTIAMIGAGGAARSVVDALARAGVRSITVINRSPERAAETAGLVACATVGVVDEVASADIVVNATSVGMGIEPGRATADDLPCPPDLLRADQVVADLVYHPLETAWLRTAAARGATTVDGLGMLVHQAALQQRIWLGDDAEIDVVSMRRAAMDELARRRS